MKKIIIAFLFYFSLESTFGMVQEIPATPPFLQLYIAKDGTLVSLVANGAVRSTNHGESWDRALKYNSNENQYILAKQLDDLILIPYSGKIYRSIDEGRSWSVSGVISNPDLSKKLFDRSGSVKSFIDEKGFIYLCDQGKLHISEDGGKIWSSVADTSENNLKNCRGVTAFRKKIYVLTDNSLIFSVNKGLNWTQVQISNFEEIFPNGSELSAQYDINLDIKEKIYAHGYKKIYVSSDYGLNWKSLEFDTSYIVSSQIYFLRSDALYLFALKNDKGDFPENRMIFRSRDSKELINFYHFYPWQDVQTSLNGDIYIMTFKAIYKTSDNGISWQILKTKGIDW